MKKSVWVCGREIVAVRYEMIESAILTALV